jgi:hypothetical protein
MRSWISGRHNYGGLVMDGSSVRNFEKLRSG